LSTAEKMSGSEPEPSPATVKGVARASCQVFTADAYQVTKMLISSVPLPSQVNLRASNWVALVPISGSIARPREKWPIVVPSLGATL
jgi:hypothetical protein